MKNKKLMLIATAAMGFVALGAAGVGTAAWFQATGAASITTVSTDTKTGVVTAGDFSTDLGSVSVTLSFVEQTESKVLGLCHYYSSANAETYGAIGWHQAYRTTGGTVVWNAAASGTLANAYGVGANAYYRVFKIKAAYTLTADQAANVPATHTINGKVSVSDSLSEGSGMTWITEEAPNNDGKTSAPTTVSTADKAFAAIDLSSGSNWTVGEHEVYSATYVCVMIDGEVHTSGNVTATIAFADVTPPAAA